MAAVQTESRPQPGPDGPDNELVDFLIPEPVDTPAAEPHIVFRGVRAAVGALRYGANIAEGAYGLLRPSESRKEFDQRVQTLEFELDDITYSSAYSEAAEPSDTPLITVWLPLSARPDTGIGREIHYLFAKHLPQYDIFVPGIEGINTVYVDEAGRDTAGMPAAKVADMTFESMAKTRMEGKRLHFGRRKTVIMPISQGGPMADQTLVTEEKQRQENPDYDTDVEAIFNYAGSGRARMSLAQAATEFGLPTVAAVGRRLPATPALHMARHIKTLATSAKWPRSSWPALKKQIELNLEGPSLGIENKLGHQILNFRIGGSKDSIFNWQSQLQLLLADPAQPMSLAVIDGLTHAAATRSLKMVTTLSRALVNPPRIEPADASLVAELDSVAALTEFLRDTNRLFYVDGAGKNMSNEYVVAQIEQALTA